MHAQGVGSRLGIKPRNLPWLIQLSVTLVKRELLLLPGVSQLRNGGFQTIGLQFLCGYLVGLNDFVSSTVTIFILREVPALW